MHMGCVIEEEALLRLKKAGVTLYHTTIPPPPLVFVLRRGLPSHFLFLLSAALMHAFMMDMTFACH